MVCVGQHGPGWVQIFFATLLGIDFIAFLIAYAYFATKTPDALRSERFYLQKLAIKRGLVGDSLTGLTPARDPMLLPSADAKRSQETEDEP
jgi:hypothetical protein